jgi:hypothetical protein
MSVGDEIQHLRDQIAQRDEVIARQAAEIVVLKQTIDALCRRIFGKSSEKLDPAQLEFMLGGDLAKKAQAAVPADPGPAAKIPTHKKAAKKTRAPRIPEHLPVVREELDPPDVSDPAYVAATTATIQLTAVAWHCRAGMEVSPSGKAVSESQAVHSTLVENPAAALMGDE